MRAREQERSEELQRAKDRRQADQEAFTNERKVFEDKLQQSAVESESERRKLQQLLDAKSSECAHSTRLRSAAECCPGALWRGADSVLAHIPL